MGALSSVELLDRMEAEMAVKFRGELISVQIKTKKTKANTEDEIIEKIGRLTIQFDGDSVDATALAELVSGRLITLELDDTQGRFASMSASR